MRAEMRVARNDDLPIPRLSKAGMPSRSEGWGGAEREPDRAKHQRLFKDEQYRLIRIASRAFIRWLRIFEQTTPGASRPPLLTKEGNGFTALFNNDTD
jgi:hypothetical protein